MNRIKEIRMRLGLTQDQVAERMGSNKSTVCDLERNRFKPSLEMANKVSNALDSTIYEVFLMTDKSNKRRDDD